MSRDIAPTPTRSTPALVWALGVYAALTLAGILGRHTALAVLAIAWLIAVLTWPALTPRGRALVAAGGALAVLGAGLAPGLGNAVLDGLPVVVNAVLAWLFARSLRTGRTPLIARVVAVIEGPERVRDTRVAHYVRRLTMAWAAWLALVALLLAAAWAVLHVAAFGAGLDVDATHAAWLESWTRLGCYAALAVFFAVEYRWRRHALPDVSQLPLWTFVARLVQRWPDVVRREVR